MCGGEAGGEFEEEHIEEIEKSGHISSVCNATEIPLDPGIEPKIRNNLFLSLKYYTGGTAKPGDLLVWAWN